MRITALGEQIAWKGRRYVRTDLVMRVLAAEGV